VKCSRAKASNIKNDFIKIQPVASKNWKLCRSQIIAFTKLDKLFETNYTATRPQLQATQQ